jgi:polyhydroxyalkanoate synthesis regulator phasin
VSDTTAAAVLILIVMALRDKNNFAPEAKMQGLIAGLSVVALGLALGLNTGGATNPARDFRPRLAAAVFGVHSWSNRHWWSIWGPWLVPFFGAFIGASIYKWIIMPISTQKAAMLQEKYDRETDDQAVRQAVLNQNSAGQSVDELQRQLARAREREEEAADELQAAEESLTLRRRSGARIHE